MAPRPLALCAPPKGRSTVARSLVIERAHRWWAPRAVAPLSRDFTVTDVEEDRGRELCTEEKQMTGFSRLDGFFFVFYNQRISIQRFSDCSIERAGRWASFGPGRSVDWQPKPGWWSGVHGGVGGELLTGQPGTQVPHLDYFWPKNSNS